MLLQVMTFTDMSLVFVFQHNSWYLKSCLDFPDGPVVNNLPASAGDAEDVSSIPGSGRSPAEGNGNPLQYSCLENPMDRGTWWATVHGVTKSQTRLKQLGTHRFHEHKEKL